MIFVTTGTALPDDRLIKKIDEQVGAGLIITEDMVMQIGNGKYIPSNVRFFKFTKSLHYFIRMSSIIISSCGAGTIFEVLEMKKPLIVVQNREITGGHEWELVSKLEELNLLFWCKNLNDLPELIKKARKHKFNKLNLKGFDYEEFNKLVGL